MISSLDGSLGTTAADGSGNWSYTPSSALAAGSHNFTVTATDAAGNASSASTALAVTIDTGISAPGTPDLATASDTGSSSSDNITSDTTPTMNGTAEANSTVTVTSSVDGSLGSTTADGSGNWTLTPSTAMTEGSHTITASATDVAGNISTASPALAITLDTVQPSVQITAPNSSVNAFSVDITFDETVNNFVVGDITVTNATLSSFSGSADSYSVTVTPQTVGTDVTLQINAGVAEDAAGNQNTASALVTVATNHVGEVTIDGNAIEGRTLTAIVTDDDGISGAITYQWLSGGNPVGSNSDSYTLQSADVGNTITVNATYTDDLSTAEDITSAATAVVISIQQHALDRISSTAGNTGNATITVDDYLNAGVTSVTEEELTRILPILNYAVANQAAATDVDELSEIEALIATIMEGQDDDGDGLPNLFEGTADTDTDGIDDRDDVDADNDGIRDNIEVLTSLDDSDSDGIIDIFDADTDNDGTLETGKLDANLDGVDDNLDTIAEFIAVYPDADKDGDSYLNSLDVDSDNDGIADVVEAGHNDADENALFDNDADLITDVADLPDTDADLTPNTLQLFSDGISRDLVVYGVLESLDADEDGKLDSTIDMDHDGLLDVVDNAVGAFGSLADVDGDGIPNHLDDDDDGDGISDADENPQLGHFTGYDADADGIDDGVDYEVNGTITGTDTNNNGVQDAYEMPDADNDGIVDYLDNDSDNDNVPDNKDPSVNTGTDVITSSGSGSSSFILLAMLLALVAWRQRRWLTMLLLLAVGSQTLAGEWVAGFGAGQSKFDPELETGLVLTEDTDTASQISLGYQVADDWIFMLRALEMGNASIGSGDVEYRARAWMGQYTPPMLRWQKLSLYLAVGISDLTTEGEGGLNVVNRGGRQPMVGGGIRYEMNEGVFFALEATSYAEDVSVVGFEISKHFN